LSWQLRQLYTLKQGGEVNAPPFILKKLRESAKRFSEKNLVECLEGLREVDREIKNGLKDPKLSLELFLFKRLKPLESKT
jgi:DNA polymerase III delta subunit